MFRTRNADPWKYHTGDAVSCTWACSLVERVLMLGLQSPFWKKFREALVINPESNSGNWVGMNDAQAGW